MCAGLLFTLTICVFMFGIACLIVYAVSGPNFVSSQHPISSAVVANMMQLACKFVTIFKMMAVHHTGFFKC